MNTTLLPSPETTEQGDANNSTVKGLPMSTKLTIGVLTGVATFGLIIIFIVMLCVLMQSKKNKINKKSRAENSRLAVVNSNQIAPYNAQFRSPSRVVPPIGAYRPGRYFREYDNWVYTAGPDERRYYPDVISDLNRKSADGSTGTQWTTISLRAHDNYDYERYGRIPRAKLCERKEELVS